MNNSTASNAVHTNEFDSDEFDDIDESNNYIWDPFEGVNRFFLNGNLCFYKFILMPVNNFYVKNVPKEVRDRVYNFAKNYTTEPVNFAISVLDFDTDGSMLYFWRFVINTSFGLFGIFDVASDFGLKPRDKSFGNLFQFYHIPRGPYIVLPFLGPNNLRDTIGWAFDLLSDPLWSSLILGFQLIPLYSYLSHVNPFFYFTGRTTDGALWVASETKTMQIFGKMQKGAEILSFILNSPSVGDDYYRFKVMYTQAINKTEEDYIKYRASIKFPSDNKCLNAFSVEDLPEECNNDEKSYKIGID